MRARELRDVIEVLVVPSLYGALRELNKPRGSQRKARLLVKQALDQLVGMMVTDKGEHAIWPDQPPLGQLQQRDTGAQGDPVVLNTGGEPFKYGADHEFVEKPEGTMRCGRCGSLDGSPSAALPCPKGAA